MQARDQRTPHRFPSSCRERVLVTWKEPASRVSKVALNSACALFSSSRTERREVVRWVRVIVSAAEE